MERANSFHRGATGSASASGSGSATTSSADSAAAAAVTPKEAIIAIVDPFSTGAHLAAQASRLGYNVVRVFSIWDSPVAALVQEGVTTDYFATLQFDDRMEDSDAATDAVSIIHIYVCPDLRIIIYKCINAYLDCERSACAASAGGCGDPGRRDGR